MAVVLATISHHTGDFAFGLSVCGVAWQHFPDAFPAGWPEVLDDVLDDDYDEAERVIGLNYECAPLSNPPTLPLTLHSPSPSQWCPAQRFS
eukprot:872944-Rhodomonas_salina.1